MPMMQKFYYLTNDQTINILGCLSYTISFLYKLHVHILLYRISFVMFLFSLMMVK